MLARVPPVVGGRGEVVDGDALAAMTATAVLAARHGPAPALAPASLALPTLALAAVEDDLAVELVEEGLAEGVVQVHSLAGDDEEQPAPEAFRNRHIRPAS